MTVRIERSLRNICMTTMAARTKGTAKKMSVTRESSASKNPPKNPARAPTAEPTRTTTRVVKTPTLTEARAPWTVRAKMSQPWMSNPKGWPQEGPW